MTGASAAPSPSPAPERLALVFQDLLTAVVRIQARREQFANVEDFRGQVLAAVGVARDQARRMGYTEDQIRAAVFAIIAFLDEAALKSANPVFREWARSPLHNKLFKAGHVAGETFFDYVRDLLMGDNSEATADVLEIYLLCLLLGYRGRYGEAGEGNLRAIQSKILEKLQGIRGPGAQLAPNALPPVEAVPRDRDRLTAGLIWAAVFAALLLIVLLVVYRVTLSSRLEDRAAGSHIEVSAV